MRKQTNAAFSRPGTRSEQSPPSAGVTQDGAAAGVRFVTYTLPRRPARAAAAAVGKCQQRPGKVAGPYLFFLASHTLTAILSPCCPDSRSFGDWLYGNERKVRVATEILRK